MAERLQIRRLDPQEPLSIEQLARYSGLRIHQLLEMVEAGVLEPEGGSRERWRFSQHAVYRARVTLRLQRDLGVNLAGVALALDLLEEIRRLRATHPFDE